VAARLGDVPLALRYFVQTAEIDLANNMGNASRGVHMAALGGLWQAVVMGFAGIRVDAGGVTIEPHLPGQWRSLRCPVQWRGHRLSITITHSPPTVHVMLQGKGAVPVRVGGGPPAAVEPGHPHVFEWRTD
jgi:trehalose/maltose hydrolase-like predicted phosphorylase